MYAVSSSICYLLSIQDLGQALLTNKNKKHKGSCVISPNSPAKESASPLENPSFELYHGRCQQHHQHHHDPQQTWNELLLPSSI
jgi:hypothetical protein